MLPLVFTSFIEVFPNWIVLEAETIAKLPIAIAFDKLFEEASLLLPMNRFWEPTVITLPASLPIALFELPVVKPDKL